MDYRVVWSNCAIENFKSIYEFIRLDSPQNTIRVVRKISEITKSLCKFPYRGHLVNEFDNSGIREIIVYKYLIIYLIVEDVILIEMIVHTAQNLNKMIILN